MLDSRAYVTGGGIRVQRTVAERPVPTALDDVLDALDARRGVLLGSSYEYPGRYKRWSLGFVDPPVELTTSGDAFRLQALNDRGAVLLAALRPALAEHAHLDLAATDGATLAGSVRRSDRPFDEGQRTRQPSVFSVLRAIVAAFASPEDRHLGLYGAFGYDLVFQLEPIGTLRPRPPDQRDLVAFLPDELTVVDHQLARAFRLSYEFEAGGTDADGASADGAASPRSTRGLPRAAPAAPASEAPGTPVSAGEGRRGPDYPPGGYAEVVRSALPFFRRGDLFEVVPSQSFREPTDAHPSALFRTLRRINPSPYGFLINLGGGEHLIGASPEMFVRVEERRVETCPISGTIARGRDAVEDAERIRTLLNSAKDEAELTMCTDVDRNDKARVCAPGSVRVIGRRQIELYSHLIHTVDHVEGILDEGYDALDAFLTHLWAVTVTGAPKRAALRFIDDAERSARRWYGGAVGCVGFDGGLNTGLTLRTIRLAGGVAEIRVGATLLADSTPEDEEQETLTKAAALFRTLEATRGAAAGPSRPAPASGGPVTDGPEADRPGAGRRVLLVDCEDSFVHSLGAYFRAGGAAVTVLRHGAAAEALRRDGWDLVVLSPGPGRPADFGVPGAVRLAAARGVPVFGVCLGMQGIVEAFGGRLDVLDEPQHGKLARISVAASDSLLFDGLPDRFTVGRYHSLHAPAASLPPALRATALTEDGVVMAVEHRTLPVAGVQFHPESIMTAGGGVGARIVANVLARLGEAAAQRPLRRAEGG